MRKRKPKKGNKLLQEADSTSSKSIPVIEEAVKVSGDGKRYPDSYLIDPQTYASLSNEMLRKPPSDRNVFISMKDYRLKNIIPSYRESPDVPTNLIVFCMRLIRHNSFQPIMVIQRYDHEDQSYVIAHCLRAIIRDLASLGLYVLATISPPANIFRRVLEHLVDIPELHKHINYISYPSEPFREILHFYDIDSILSDFQNLFYIHKEVCFIADDQLRYPKWQDVQFVLESNRISCGYTDANSREYSIFNHRFQLDIGRTLDKEKQKINRDVEILVNMVFPFSSMRDMNRNSIEILTSVYDSLDDLKIALGTMHFRTINLAENNKGTRLQSRNSSKSSSTNGSTVIEIAKSEIDNIIESIDKSIDYDTQFDALKAKTKSLVHVLCDHLAKSQKETLKNEYNVDLNNLPKVTKKSDDWSISSGDFEVNDMPQFIENMNNFKENNNTVISKSQKNSVPEHRKKKIQNKSAKNKEASNVIFDIEHSDKNKNTLVDKHLNSSVVTDIKKSNLDLDNTRNEIDAKDYITFLKQSCDENEIEEFSDILKYDVYKNMFDTLREHYTPNRLTNDWLATVQAVQKLKDKLYSRRVKEFLPSALTLVHSDYFVDVIKTTRNGYPRTPFNAPEDMTILDYNAALSMMANSVYLIKKD